MRYHLDQHLPRIARQILPAVLTLILLGCGACGGGSGPSTPTVPTQPTPQNIAGTYTLTVTASSVCTQLPITSFSFGVVNITETPNVGDPALANVAGNFPSCTACRLLGGSVTATAIAALSTGLSGYVNSSGVVLQTTTGQQVTVAGVMGAPVPASPIVGTINGDIDIITASPFTTRTCTAADHRVTLTKQ